MQTGRSEEENLIRRHGGDSDIYEMANYSEKERLYTDGSALSDPADVFGARRGGARRFSTFAAARSRKPLIDYAKTVWRYDHRYAQRHDEPDFLMSTVSKVRNAFRSRRVQRNVFISSIVLVTSLFAFYTYIGPRWIENYRLTKSLSNQHRMDSGGLFGTNISPIFSDMVHIKTLDKSLIPGIRKTMPGRPGSRRLIFVGDVHGCKDELLKLLQVVRFNQSTDHLILLGDIVAKGPDSLGVIDLAISLNATSVRGNHDDRVLLAHKELKSTIRPMHNDNNQGPSSPSPPLEDTAPSSLSSSEHHAIAHALTPAQHAYLSSAPLILFIPAFSKTHGHLLAVHAGLVPGVSLSHQDPFSIMNMRSIDLATHAPHKHAASDSQLQSFWPSASLPPSAATRAEVAARFEDTFLVPWTKLWNKYQQLLPDPRMKRVKQSTHAVEGHATVLYGHDARRGLRLEKWTKGLDSGCVRGGHLTAMIFEDGGRTSAVQVPCRDYVGMKKKMNQDKDKPPSKTTLDEKTDDVGGR